MNNLRNKIGTTIKKYLIESKNKDKRKSRLIMETQVRNKTIINVDIQPEYEDYITFDINEWVDFINESSEFNRIVFLYNGYDTLGMVDEDTYKNWLYDLGIDEDVLYEATFYDKGYAFFRYCMDNSIDEDTIIDLVKYMIRHNITNSRDIDEDMWNDYMEETNHNQEDVRDLLENANDMINIPDLMEFMDGFSNIILTGGGVDECLKEVEIGLLSLEKNYNIIDKYTY